ncbi:hypothetical protein ABT084_34400, partial [Streptomyces sp. NPDC002138]
MTDTTPVTGARRPAPAPVAGAGPAHVPPGGLPAGQLPVAARGSDPAFPGPPAGPVPAPPAHPPDPGPAPGRAPDRGHILGTGPNTGLRPMAAGGPAPDPGPGGGAAAAPWGAALGGPVRVPAVREPAAREPVVGARLPSFGGEPGAASGGPAGAGIRRGGATGVQLPGAPAAGLVIAKACRSSRPLRASTPARSCAGSCCPRA